MNLFKNLFNLFNNFINFLLPPKCYICSSSLIEGEEVLCLVCLYDLALPDNILENKNNQTAAKFHGKIYN